LLDPVDEEVEKKLKELSLSKQKENVIDELVEMEVNNVTTTPTTSAASNDVTSDDVSNDDNNVSYLECIYCLSK
jgi:hypothetical protein